jgi:DNA-binding NarL/FixJ family response regulator
MIRTAMIEDDPATMRRMEQAIAASGDVVVVAKALDASTGGALIKAGGFDVLLCDLGLPDGDGITLIRQAASLYPEADILVVTLFADQRNVIKCIEAGARGYLVKDQKIERCVDAIRDIRAGGSPISPIIARQLLQRIKPDILAKEDSAVVTLTVRENHILRILSRGFSYAECADLLEISPHTVGTHVKNIYRKLEVSSRAEAVFEATSLGMLQGD